MEEGKKHIHYSAEYIRKYLEGELSATEMLALEKAALEDPFLSDVIEGYEESRKHPGSFESGVEALQKKLAQRVAKKNRKTGIVWMFSNWQVAASVLFILGAALFSVIILNKNRKAELADRIIKDSNTKENIPLPARKEADGTDAHSNKPLPLNPESDTMGAAITRSLSDKPDKNGESQVYPQAKEPAKTGAGKEDLSINREDKREDIRKKESNTTIVPFSEIQRDSIGEKTAAFVPAKIREESLAAPKPGEAQANTIISGVAIEKDKNFSGNILKGQVVDEKDKPIPFAAVSIKGTKKRTLTDTGGFFKLYMKNPSLASLVFTNPGGNEPMKAELISDSAYINKFRLRESEPSLNEAEVSMDQTEIADAKSGTRRKTDTVAGWSAFSHYVNENKKIITADSLLKGDEIISFLVYPDGKLASFKIVKSVSPAHDAEILRLIKSAPALKPPHGKKQKCRLTITFK